MPTIKDIAKRANVSTATVSYVINNTRYVSPEKRERVERAIKELNYVPNAVARGLRVRRSKVISLIIADIANPFYPDLAKACEETAKKEGYTVTIMNTNDEQGSLPKAVSQLREGTVEGLIVTTALNTDVPFLEQLLQEGYPIVLAHRCPEMDIDTVMADNFQGGFEAANHLIELGHAKIAFMRGVQHSPIDATRTLGYKKAMELAGFHILKEWLPTGLANYEKSYQECMRLLELPKDKRPTALINIGDIGALGAIDAASDKGLSVPDDLAVIGFDDLFLANLRSVQLTTVRMPRFEIGQRATERLIEKMKNRTDSRKLQVTLPVELIKRKTCGWKK